MSFERYFQTSVILYQDTPHHPSLFFLEIFIRREFFSKYSVCVILGLLERLNDGETVIVAEGYLYEFERRGYLKAGAFVPEVVVEHPDLVRALHEEFAHAGSDVIEAFTVSTDIS